MTNSEKKFPGLKWMLIASLVVFILVVAWITVSLVGAPILNLVDVEPVMGLFAVLALMAVFAVSVYGGAGVLIVMWVVYGIFLVVRCMLKKTREEETR